MKGLLFLWSLRHDTLTLGSILFLDMEAFWKGDRKSSFWIFMEALLYSHDWPNHWLMVMESTSSTFPGNQVVRWWDWRLQLSNHMTGSPGNKPLSLDGFQSHFPCGIFRNWGLDNKYPITLITQEIPRSGRCEPGIVDWEQVYLKNTYLVAWMTK